MPTKMKFQLRPKTKRKRKWKLIFGRKKRQRKSPDNINVFSFSYSHQLSQPYNALPITRPVSPFCRLSLLTGFHFPHVHCIDISGIFLDNISTRKQFAFLVYCYRVKANFHNLCTVLYWRLCSLTNSPPIVKYLLN